MHLAIYMTLKSRRVQIVDVRSSNLAQWFIRLGQGPAFWTGESELTENEFCWSWVRCESVWGLETVFLGLGCNVRWLDEQACYVNGRCGCKPGRIHDRIFARYGALSLTLPNMFHEIFEESHLYLIRWQFNSAKKEIRTSPDWEVYSLIVWDANRWLPNKGLSVKRKAKKTYAVVRSSRLKPVLSNTRDNILPLLQANPLLFPQLFRAIRHCSGFILLAPFLRSYFLHCSSGTCARDDWKVWP